MIFILKYNKWKNMKNKKRGFLLFYISYIFLVWL